MDKALNYIALAHKGRLIELGEEPVGAITRTVKGYLVVVASDASDHTWRRAKSFVAGTEQQCISLPFTKEELGFVVGRTSLAIAAFTDAAMALAFVKALPNPEKYQKEAEILDQKNQKLRQRQKEAKAHQRNVRTGKKK
ncbi:MAG: 50S ribosomal protein L7 [Oscillospiraceae bacterium]|nr:50S ribosomal protein L7 [Oscillospiraceae bacterium]